MGAAALVGCSVGCAAATTQVLREPVTVVPTRTPGVTFVIVRPAFSNQSTGVQQPGDGGLVRAASEYVLICDARAAAGMSCAIPSEAAFARYSYTPRAAVAPTNIDEGIGTLADVRIAREGVDEPAPVPEPVAAPPPVVPPAPAMAPAPAPGAPLTGSQVP